MRKLITLPDVVEISVHTFIEGDVALVKVGTRTGFTVYNADGSPPVTQTGPYPWTYDGFARIPLCPNVCVAVGPHDYMDHTTGSVYTIPDPEPGPRQSSKWLKQRASYDRSVVSHSHDGTETHVALVGGHVALLGPTLFGPSASSALVRTKGIKNGVVLARRGGIPRSFPLGKRFRPLWVKFADDGLTLYTLTREGLYQIDVD